MTVLPEGIESELDRFLGLRVEEASGERVVATLAVTPDLH